MIEFGQIVRETVTEEGIVVTTTQSFFDGEERSYKETIREDKKTSYNTLLSDVIACLDVFKTSDTPELIITIKRDSSLGPNIIQKQWQRRKEDKR